MGETVAGIHEALTRLHRAQGEILAEMSQAEIVSTLAVVARRWRDPDYPLRRDAERWQEPFPFAMVQVSLDALLDSLSPEELWRLIDTENVRDTVGYPVIGHVIAGNTPLLAWVSVIRALLVRSASFVKLPSGPSAQWGRIFHQMLMDVSPQLSECVYLAYWPGGTTELDAALCRGAGLLMAHGNDGTIRALQALCPANTPLIGYGHRVSFGLVPQGQGTREVADGFARDVLLYDQGGCLSPQTIFVEGDWEEATAFAAQLAEALAQAAARYPLPVRAGRAAMTVREARLLARMEEGNALWEDPNLRWTVIARSQKLFVPSPTFGVISAQPLETLEDLPEAVAPVAAYLQGCAVAGGAQGYLPVVSRFCQPGELQAPPLSWRQDGRDVLRLLLPCAFNPCVETHG